MFWRFLTSLTATGGRFTCAALACLAVLRFQGVDCRGALLGLLGSIPSPPTCVAGALGTSALSPEVGLRACSLGGGQEDAPEGSSGDCRPALSGLLQLGYLFLVEKATGGWRPIIDLSALNGFVTLTKFRMETVASVLGSIRKGDWMFSIDLKDAYFHIPIHPDFCLYFWFCLKSPVPCPVLWPVHSSTGVYQGLLSDFGVLSGWLADCDGVVAPSAALGSSSPVVLFTYEWWLLLCFSF